MAQTRTIKRARSSRTTHLQYNKMLDFFYLNKGLAEGKLSAIYGKEVARKKWTELAAELNEFQGATKTVEQWQVVWRDLKSRTSVKARVLRKMSGNKFMKQAELSELEMRVIGLVGLECIEESKDCADDIAEDESSENELKQDIPRYCDTFSPENLQEDPQTWNEDRANRKRKSGVQHYSSKDRFENIAEKQADAMMIFAQASKTHAEAVMVNAHAMKEMARAATKLANTTEIQAVNDAERIQVTEKLVQVLENLLPSYIT